MPTGDNKKVQGRNSVVDYKGASQQNRNRQTYLLLEEECLNNFKNIRKQNMFNQIVSVQF